MKTDELVSRLVALEKLVDRLQKSMRSRNVIAHDENENPTQQHHWWRDDAGKFKDDPIFDEIVRLGREYRQSLHPDFKKRQAKKRKLNKKNARS